LNGCLDRAFAKVFNGKRHIVLPAGMTLRFKNRVRNRCDEWAEALHGRCKRDSNELLITQDTEVIVDRPPPSEVET
jgi:hypothetical protein